MRICPEALPFVLPPAVAGAVAGALGAWVVAAALLLTAALLAAFFRDPERTSNAPPNAVLAPADGRVVEVQRDADGTSRIAIFLSVFNVHVARAPADGDLHRCERITGSHAAAYRAEAADNARVAMDMHTPQGPMELALMAGAVARRIVMWVAAPARLRRGQRIAIIRFGSRAELRLPPGLEPRVRDGDRVRAGATVVAGPPETGP